MAALFVGLLHHIAEVSADQNRGLIDLSLLFFYIGVSHLETLFFMMANIPSSTEKIPRQLLFPNNQHFVKNSVCFSPLQNLGKDYLIFHKINNV